MLIIILKCLQFRVKMYVIIKAAINVNVQGNRRTNPLQVNEEQPKFLSNEQKILNKPIFYLLDYY